MKAHFVFFLIDAVMVTAYLLSSILQMIRKIFFKVGKYASSRIIPV